MAESTLQVPDTSKQVDQIISPDGSPQQPPDNSPPPSTGDGGNLQPEVIVDEGMVAPKLDPNIDFSSFTKRLDDVIPSAPVTPDSAKKEDETTTPPQPAVTKKVDTQPAAKKDQTLPPKKANLPAERDLTGLDEAHTKLFREMSNEAFATLKPIYTESRELKKQLSERDKKIEELSKGQRLATPESYYEHPEAVVLTSEFKQARNELDFHSYVYNHWARELLNVEKGAKTIKELALDPQTNKWFIKQEVPADPDNAFKLKEFVEEARLQVNAAKGNLHHIQATHGDRVKEAKSFIEDYNRNTFSVFESEEGKKKYGAMVEDSLNKFHPAYRNNPLLRTTVYSLLLNQMLGNLLEQAKQEKLAGGNGAGQPSAQRQPSGGEISGDGGGGAKKKVIGTDITDFKKRMDS